MIKNRFFEQQNGRKAAKVFLLLTLIVAAGFSLLNLSTAITQAKFDNSAVKMVEALNQVSQSALLSAATSTPLVIQQTATTTALASTTLAAVKKVATTSAKTVKSSVKKIATKTTAAAKKTKVASTGSGVKWAASAMAMMNRMASFDYSYTIRRATMNKIENYAKQHHITVITAAVINSIQE